MRIGRRALTAILIAAAALVTVACSSGAGGGESSTLPPITADVSTVDGTTVEVPAGGTLVITGDEETYTAWTADIDDEAILTFTPGRDDGSASFNPGFEAKKPGTTDVEMDNSENGDHLAFTVEVTPAE